MIKVLVSDLVLIADYMRLLKQKDAMWLGNHIVGIDNMSYIIISSLDIDRLSIIPTKGLIFNQRELSKFMKSISIESDFEIDDSGMINTTTLTTIANTESMNVVVNTAVQKVVEQHISQSVNIDRQMAVNSIKPEMDVTTDLQDLYKMSKSSGIYNYIYDNNHLMTLFSGIFPLAKNDKIFCTVMDINDISFIARFRVHKKTCDIVSYLHFRRI